MRRPRLPRAAAQTARLWPAVAGARCSSVACQWKARLRRRTWRRSVSQGPTCPPCRRPRAGPRCLDRTITQASRHRPENPHGWRTAAPLTTWGSSFVPSTGAAAAAAAPMLAGGARGERPVPPRRRASTLQQAAAAAAPRPVATSLQPSQQQATQQLAGPPPRLKLPTHPPALGQLQPCPALTAALAAWLRMLPSRGQWRRQQQQRRSHLQLLAAVRTAAGTETGVRRRQAGFPHCSSAKLRSIAQRARVSTTRFTTTRTRRALTTCTSSSTKPPRPLQK